MIIFLKIKATEKLFRRRHYVYDLPSQAQRRVRAILGRTAFKKAATIREPSRRIDDFIAVSKTTEPTPPKGPGGEEECEFD